MSLLLLIHSLIMSFSYLGAKLYCMPCYSMCTHPCTSRARVRLGKQAYCVTGAPSLWGQACEWVTAAASKVRGRSLGWPDCLNCSFACVGLVGGNSACRSAISDTTVHAMWSLWSECVNIVSSLSIFKVVHPCFSLLGNISHVILTDLKTHLAGKRDNERALQQKDNY